MSVGWSDEEIDAAIGRAKGAYHDAAMRDSDAAGWRAAVLAILNDLFEDDYLSEHEDVRTFLVEDAEEARWVGPYTVAIGEGASACKANRSENPNWVLQHAANALMLYRVLTGDEPWPEDPKAVERRRMAKVLERVDPGSSTAVLALTLQELGFTLPERPAA